MLACLNFIKSLKHLDHFVKLFFILTGQIALDSSNAVSTHSCEGPMTFCHRFLIVGDTFT